MNQENDELTLSSYTIASYILGFDFACETLCTQTGIPKEKWAEWISTQIENTFKDAKQEDINKVIYGAIDAQNESESEE
ncbi:hypothetical protein DSM106972_016100 [Dulcicalothrix desertica PCC 7102]|uniref:Uncharacterized protein n=1 Tax=Dulcicalothrix desertica PCC 7102 TaxID=232991 RepID=A0A433VQZ0_9CYAN|nr:hypothetical protein [Dulcicalothrix desertica]RUT08442.1 hypothetical protein DSM106972_016100 [Dulcicalothrix desertica PCC 7102]TWH40306.1 hypothetical protein CAL7102_09614 [Dulcicalothrix desertica PCC 7102]